MEQIKDTYQAMLKKVFDLFKNTPQNAEEENEMLAGLGKTQDEKDAIAIICNEIDNYHEEMQVMEDNDIDEDRLGEYTAFRIEKFVEENEPDLTEEDKSSIKDDVEKALETVIINESVGLANDVAGEEVDVDDIINDQE